MNKLIKLIQEETDLPIDYLIAERVKCKDSGLRLDCKNFIHWDMKSVAYSTCNHYKKYFMNMDKDCCNNCKFFVSKFNKGEK